ncbi:LysR family transcriptional regulator [Pseudomonas sp. JQ170]|uniref:LysR substrate-binding domain-containing protein n=1 Tax=unclassified Pseudomonas TaxID=196821 RepID=UPI00264DC918|nr:MULTISPECIES: LysR substrate-binding domain-containing protein [unclassified Pseudomonas]MDN7142266.1 LysR family transcriptional regulator [Pseudomonas sp. JQ170]WRO76832.1 LysR substrate-binding domain-containing protein [Pseudomonas sp. 170C]
MNLRHLEAFRAVMLGQTVTRAAEMLHISQPAATRLIAALEEDIGLTLFDRVKGRLHPTAEAHVLFEEVQRSLLGVERIARTAREIVGLKRGSLHIACAPALGLSFLPRAISAFLADHEQVQITLEVLASREVVDRLMGQRCDLGMIAEPDSYLGPRGELLFRSPLLCALPAGHRLQGQPKVVPEDLEGEAFVSYPSNIASRQYIDAIFAAHGVSRDLRVETQLSLPMCNFVANGQGVALIDAISALEFAGGGVVFLPFEPTVEMDFTLLLPAQVPSSRLLARFIEHLHDFVEQQVPASYRR